MVLAVGRLHETEPIYAHLEETGDDNAALFDSGGFLDHGASPGDAIQGGRGGNVGGGHDVHTLRPFARRVFSRSSSREATLSAGGLTMRSTRAASSLRACRFSSM